MSANIRELAEYCGLSMSAVSKALNGYSDISDATRNAVLKAAKELDYHPNAHARALKAGRSYNLGVLFSDDSQSGLTHPFFSLVLDSLKAEAEARGYSITFINPYTVSDTTDWDDYCKTRMIEGLCIVCADFGSENIKAVAESSVPCVTVDHIYKHVPAVLSDNETGIQKLLEYAISRGHKKIAFLSDNQSGVDLARLNGYKKALKDAGIKYKSSNFLQIRPKSDEIDESLAEICDRSKEFTAIFCVSDLYAVTLISALTDRGVNVPEEISIVGFDDNLYSRICTPRLTTVHQDADEKGRVAVETLVGMIMGREPVSKKIVLKTHLVTRDSVRKI